HSPRGRRRLRPPDRRRRQPHRRRPRARAAPPRWRARRRRDLLRRWPGRRDRDRGQRGLICSEQPASELSPRAAAFFDLDKTLMAGSSGMQFARIAAKQGIVGKRQLASWGFEHLRYRLRGTTDERTSEVLKVARELIRGVPAKNIDRMGPEVMAAILPRVFPQMLEEVYAHQDAGRPTFIVSAAGNGVVEQLAHVLGMDGGIGTRYEA